MGKWIYWFELVVSIILECLEQVLILIMLLLFFSFMVILLFWLMLMKLDNLFWCIVLCIVVNIMLRFVQVFLFFGSGRIEVICLFCFRGSMFISVLLCEVGLLSGRCQIFILQQMLCEEKNSIGVCVLVINRWVIKFFFLVVIFDWFLLFWCWVWQVVKGICLIQLLWEMVIIMFFCWIRFFLLKFVLFLIIFVWCGVVNLFLIFSILVWMIFWICVCECRMLRKFEIFVLIFFNLLLILLWLRVVSCCRCRLRIVWVCFLDSL